MKIPFYLDPRNILILLDEIDSQVPSYSLNRKDSLRRTFWTLACVAVCLLLIHYMKYNSAFRGALELLSVNLGHHSHYYLAKINSTGFGGLLAYAWWTFWHVIGYIVIPFLVIRYVLKAGFLDMGWRWNGTHRHWKGYAVLLSPILVFVVIVSQGQSFVNHYPFYKLASRSWFDLIAWEVLYLLQFVCLEYFFRGFFLNSLRPAIGANAVWVMCVPYLMIHFPKLWPEASGAILFGLFLGILALRSRSIWGGFFVHAGVAVSMDVSSLIMQDKIPAVFWPF
ncbi:MAG: CPBP family intramembrane metalloprotease [Gammaproteobacteria bacterium]|nr:MAG: CPBP family intramembrane metalloprotease [Gammaproteobacteria bacterium]